MMLMEGLNMVFNIANGFLCSFVPKKMWKICNFANQLVIVYETMYYA